MAKVFKVEMYVVDANGEYGDSDELKQELSDLDDKIFGSPMLRVAKIEESKEFEWDDNLKINKTKAMNRDFEQYLKKKEIVNDGKHCDKCGHELKMHYIRFCPKCDTSVLIKDSDVTGDLFKIMYHMEANGYLSKRRFWDWFTNMNDISNDTSIKVTLNDDSFDEEINEYMAKVAELLGVEFGSTVNMWISW